MRFALLLFSIVAAVSLTSCDDDDSPTATLPEGVTVTLSSQTLVAPARAAGDLQISRARFVLRDLKFHTPDGPEEMEFVTGPFVVDLNLNGSLNEVAAANVPADTYDEVRFKIHKLDDDDPRDLAAMREPEFADFVGPDRLSVRVEGTYDDGNGAAPFNFTSDLNEEQRVFLAPFLTVAEEDSSINVTMIVDTTGWFDDGQGGTLDPRNPSNTDEIEENISSSIDIFEDRDRDGREDDS